MRGPEKCADVGVFGKEVLNCTHAHHKSKSVGAPAGVLAGACHLWGVRGGVRVQGALPLGSFG